MPEFEPILSGRNRSKSLDLDRILPGEDCTREGIESDEDELLEQEPIRMITLVTSQSSGSSSQVARQSSPANISIPPRFTRSKGPLLKGVGIAVNNKKRIGKENSTSFK